MLHRTCYRSYNRPDVTSYVNPNERSEFPDNEYAGLESDAYQILFDCLRSDVVANEKVERLSEMTQLLVECLMSLGVKECKPATKKHIRKNIEAEFSELLDSARVFLITASLTPEQIARSIVSIVMSGEENKASITKISNIQKAAADIRETIRSKESMQCVMATGLIGAE